MRLLVVVAISFSAHVLPAQRLHNGKSTIRKLCSPRFYGRGYQRDGHLKAAFWIGDKIQRLGLLPFQGSYLHPFIIPSIVVAECPPSVMLNGRKLLTGIDFQLHPASNSGSIEWNRGTRSASVALLYQKPPYLASELLEQHDSLGKPSALVYIHPRLTNGIATQRVPFPVLELSESFAKDKLYTLNAQVRTSIQSKVRSYNVAGLIHGKDTTKTILIGAHYDHLGGYPGGTYYPGASDNASGIALWLSLAHYFAQKKHIPPCNLLFVAFGGEEIGLLGSAAFVRQYYPTVRTLAFMLNLDIAGTGDAGITVVNSTVFQEHFRTLTQLNNSLNLIPKLFTRGKAPISDHHWFTEEGIPSLYLYTMSNHPTYYHQVQDKPASVSLSHFVPLGRLLVHFIQSF